MKRLLILIFAIIISTNIHAQINIDTLDTKVAATGIGYSYANNSATLMAFYFNDNLNSVLGLYADISTSFNGGYTLTTALVLQDINFYNYVQLYPLFGIETNQSKTIHTINTTVQTHDNTMKYNAVFGTAIVFNAMNQKFAIPILCSNKGFVSAGLLIYIK